jgi:hypothetical protein
MAVIKNACIAFVLSGLFLLMLSATTAMVVP